DSLKAWLSQKGKQLSPGDRFEYDFGNEGSAVGPVQLTGKVDRLIIDEKTRTITIVDYKTGKPHDRWQSGIPKLYMFRRQLILYKLLVENSARYKGYKIEKGIIQFVEPDEHGRLNHLELFFDDEEVELVKKLIMAIWVRIQAIDFPDASAYPKTLAGINQFETDLLNQNAGQESPASNDS
ncbi:PD-(D/E)XK nuclease family protein, partial [Candidatus Saccharibacteria bacterium]|nr:PD-(D/E)XK nuclease family protein [Candidatus Saccharibacteria bacterium]